MSNDMYMSGVFETNCVMDGNECQSPNPWNYKSSNTSDSLGQIFSNHNTIFGNN